MADGVPVNTPSDDKSMPVGSVPDLTANVGVWLFDTSVKSYRLNDRLLPTVPLIVWLSTVIVPAAIMSQVMIMFGSLEHLFADTRTFPSGQVGTDEGVPESMPDVVRVNHEGCGE